MGSVVQIRNEKKRKAIEKPTNLAPVFPCVRPIAPPTKIALITWDHCHCCHGVAPLLRPLFWGKQRRCGRSAYTAIAQQRATLGAGASGGPTRRPIGRRLRGAHSLPRARCSGSRELAAMTWAFTCVSPPTEFHPVFRSEYFSQCHVSILVSRRHKLARFLAA